MTESKTGGADRIGAATWYALTLLTLIFVVNQIDRSVIGAIQEQIKHEFSLTDSQLGLLSGLVTGGIYGVCVIPLAVLADRMNRRNLIAIIMVIWSLATMGSAFATGFMVLLAARMVVIGAESGTVPASLSLISDLFPPKRRASAVSLYYVAASAGLTIAYLFGGLVAQTFGWRKAFLLAGTPGLLFTLILLFTFTEPARGATDTEAAPAVKTPLSRAFRDIAVNPVLLLLFLGGTLATVSATILSVWVASLLIRDHGMDLKTAGFTVAITQGVISAIGMAATGPLADRFSRGDPRRALNFAAWTMVIAALSGAVFSVSASTAVAVAGLAVCGLTNRSYLGPMLSTVLGAAEPNRRALTISMLNICTTCVGAGFGPVIAGALSDAFGGPHSLQPALLVSVLVYLPAAALFVWAGALMKRQRLGAAAQATA